MKKQIVDREEFERLLSQFVDKVPDRGDRRALKVTPEEAASYLTAEVPPDTETER